VAEDHLSINLMRVIVLIYRNSSVTAYFHSGSPSAFKPCWHWIAVNGLLPLSIGWA
jgi:hypothetical protein